MLYRGLFLSFVLVFLISGCNEPNDNSETSPFDDVNVQAAGPDTPDVQAVRLYVDAMMLNDLQKWDEAIRKLNNAIEFAPNFSLAWSFKGDIYQLNEQYEKSANSYEQATKVDPWSFTDFSNLGKVCQILDDFARAVKAYVTACELNTNDFDVHLGAAKCYYELDNYDLAFGYGQRAKDISPGMGEAETLLGDIYEMKDDKVGARASYERAVTAYRRVLEAQGNEPKTMVALAVAYLKLRHMKQKRFESAQELLTGAIEIDPDNGAAYQYLGFVQLQLYKTDLAVAMKSYKKAVEIDMKDFMAHKGLGVVYMLKFVQGGQEDEAVKQLAIDQWDISLALKSDQPDLRDLMKKCTAPIE
jgi:tetratricopeptide (TPR) repeat protein